MKIKRTLNNAEIATFCSQTAMLFQAGITPAESMRILLGDATSEGSKEVITQILDVCKVGDPFGKALASTNVFPDYVIQMVTLGEESGNLEECMTSLASYYEKEDNISSNIRSAIAYPMIMIVMMVTVIFVLISKVMPIFEQVFRELGSEMTGFAGSLLNLGNSLNQYSLILIICIVFLFALYLFCTKTGAGRKHTAHVLQRLPLTKKLYADIASQRFAGSLAVCLGSGIDVYHSLDITKKLVDSKQMEAKIDLCKSTLSAGSGFAEALIHSKIFSRLYSQMVGVGFKSGNADVVLRQIADGYEKSTDRRMHNLISILEPTLVIILSVIVGLILLSVILPLMGIMASIG